MILVQKTRKGRRKVAFFYFCQQMNLKQRYFLELAYFGKPYVGWQSQPNGLSVQATIENTLSTILQEDIKVMGCGRTDAGVHASQFYLHFDGSTSLPEHFLDRINKMIGLSIAFRKIHPVASDAHVRFDATSRSYTYYINGKKNPFANEVSTFFSQMNQLDFDRMQKAVQILLNYDEFLPFCKTNSDAQTMRCNLTESKWIKQSDCDWEFHITSNRFLRGMVRLIVGMSLRVGQGKMSLDEVKYAMDKQKMIEKSFSAPAEGLFLSAVKYPYIS